MAMGAAQAYLEAQGITDFGPAIFKYNRVQMPGLEIDFGFLTPTRLPAAPELVSGELPAGTYATLTYTGPYDDLIEVNAVLIGWAAHKGIQWDATPSPDGDLFASRVEFYLDGPEGDRVGGRRIAEEDRDLALRHRVDHGSGDHP